MFKLIFRDASQASAGHYFQPRQFSFTYFLSLIFFMLLLLFMVTNFNGFYVNRLTTILNILTKYTFSIGLNYEFKYLRK